MENSIFNSRINLIQTQSKALEIKNQIAVHVVGQTQTIELLLIALLASDPARCCP